MGHNLLRDGRSGKGWLSCGLVRRAIHARLVSSATVRCPSTSSGRSFDRLRTSGRSVGGGSTGAPRTGDFWVPVQDRNDVGLWEIFKVLGLSGTLWDIFLGWLALGEARGGQPRPFAQLGGGAVKGPMAVDCSVFGRGGGVVGFISWASGRRKGEGPLRGPGLALASFPLRQS